MMLARGRGLVLCLALASVSGSRLHDAAARGDAKQVRSLMNKRAMNVNLQASDGSTALMVASAFGYASVVEELLLHNAEIGSPSASSSSTLPHAPCAHACALAHHRCHLWSDLACM
jgi:ankyrin repeat protein